MIIAIDGPAGSGKSTAAKGLAERLGFTYLDSGAMYRAFTWKVSSSGADFSDKEGLCRLLDETSIRIECSAGGSEVFVDDVNVTREIRHPSITENIHHVSSLDFVRKKMVELQRDFARGKDIIAEGRDMCSVVFPDADKKIYMDADVKERAKRRYSELRAFNDEGSIDNVVEDIVRRDHRDSTRQFAPLKREPDALYLDTTSLEAEDVVDILTKEIEKEQQKD
ncbi:MAG: (d)CMP kinase [Candidatus Scalindua sp.]|nr:(d)CMP kinase [Candidatus Scalindua sp.]MCR4343615.1 (d)CMP kinase [Candidatus Scalindua sp.]